MGSGTLTRDVGKLENDSLSTTGRVDIKKRKGRDRRNLKGNWVPMGRLEMRS